MDAIVTAPTFVSVSEVWVPRGDRLVHQAAITAT